MPSSAEPHSTGTARLWIVASRSTLWISVGRHGLFGQQQFGQLVAVHRKLIEHLAAPQVGLVVQFGGNVGLDDLGPLLVG